ncbi:hypothetical protein HZ326_26330, partial [Fusarium oxysporum f. sp. albedinis]
MAPCPDCCRGFAIACSADRFRVATMISRCWSPSGMHLRTIAIASSSAMYAFCSSLGP